MAFFSPPKCHIKTTYTLHEVVHREAASGEKKEASARVERVYLRLTVRLLTYWAFEKVLVYSVWDIHYAKSSVIGRDSRAGSNEDT